MKKVLSKLFGRLVLTAIIILIQFGWIALTLYEAGEINPWFSLSLRVVQFSSPCFVYSMLISAVASAGAIVAVTE